MADLWSQLKAIKAMFKRGGTQTATPSTADKNAVKEPPNRSPPVSIPAATQAKAEAPISTSSSRAQGKPVAGGKLDVAEVAKPSAVPTTPPKRVDDHPTRTGELKPVGVASVFKALPKGDLTRRKLFRMPEGWIAGGGSTQLSAVGARGAVDIVVGLDFGTSYTKAAVGFMDKIYPVTWEGVSSCTPAFLLPSEYSSLENASVFLGQHPDADIGHVHSDLKLPFINPSVSAGSIERASIFVALVLRYVRAWVYRHHGSKIGSRAIRWHLNIGAPCDGLESGALTNAYRRLAGTAWQRSLCLDSNRVAPLGTGLWSDGQPSQDLSEPGVFPEFVAQMAGYMQSPQMRRGLHALVDVGGGTLDIVTFIVHKVEDEDVFPFLVPRVCPLGTHGLLQNRIAGVAPDVEPGPIDELAPIQDGAVFAKSVGLDATHVAARDTLFVRELRSRVSSVFDVTKNKRYKQSPAWESRVRTFFTGGGSHLDLYLKALTSANVRAKGGLQLVPLPMHPRLDGFSGSEQEYQRISVACGLAQDAFSLGRVVPAKNVSDDENLHPVIAQRLDRDDLYAR